MNYAELTDDELRLEVARRQGKRVEPDKSGRFWLECLSDDKRRILPYYCTDLTAAIALLDGTGAEYNLGKRIAGTPKTVYDVIIWGYYSAFGDDYEATADTLPRAACVAWLEWMEAQHDNS